MYGSCSHTNRIRMKDIILCVDCGKQLNSNQETKDKEYREYRRKKLCSKGKHKFISDGSDVYCKYCGEVRENIGYASLAGGNRPLRKGKFEEGVWGK